MTTSSISPFFSVQIGNLMASSMVSIRPENLPTSVYTQRSTAVRDLRATSTTSLTRMPALAISERPGSRMISGRSSPKSSLRKRMISSA
ncbi:hypothetical protein D3C84_1068210 [compost metagenome]